MGWIQAPDGAKETPLPLHESVAPAGALALVMNEPTADAVGYSLPRLRRWKISRRDYVIQPSVDPAKRELHWVRESQIEFNPEWG